MNCKFLQQCRELATIGFPVHKREKTVGVIGIIGFSPEQKEKMLHHSEKWTPFLQHISSLIEHKLLELDAEREKSCHIQEEVPEASAPPVYFAQLIGAETGLRDVIAKAKKVTNSISTVSLEQMLADYERSVLQRYYADSSFAQDKAAIANELKISSSTLYRKLEKYGLE
ncbi:hypothetical protein [Brevibacillus centrosporus]|uniref:Regulatory protein, Fis family n=1 Tax=Brevibacillus centrosporus TaxID=54910 RepID=A0A1I3UWS3_9BACL|nr:hypothetical protein [Brevibacillus centrosporus]MED4907280.1 hypothetical protein [Brevibacillus centrosporus]SFJ87824.1 regulatory protein, Fis family [Brevibacillus centrosporus]